MSTESNDNKIKLDWAIQGKPYKDNKFETDRVLISDDEGYVFEVGGTSKEKCKQNANKIVMSVNNHDKLVEALQTLLEFTNPRQVGYKSAKQLLKKLVNNKKLKK